MTLDDVSRTQINQIPTDFEAFLNARSGRSGQRKRRGHFKAAETFRR